MRYILEDRYRLRGWYKLPTGVFDKYKKEAVFLSKDEYTVLLKCDGAHDFDMDSIDEKEKKILSIFKNEGTIRPAMFGDFLKDDQMYTVYPARYRRSVHWSITGACNLKCRHCFMSAPNAKHGVPSHEEIINTIDQLAECGIFQVGITGGEPLIREDFYDILDALCEREIGVNVIYTNGWLVDENLLDELDKRKMHPSFQLSYDGIGFHDWLRGVPGAEERTVRALKLLQERDYRVSVSMCIHKKNCHTIRDSINFLASLGVTSMKCSIMMELGEWTNPELNDIKLTKADEIDIFERYIPQYFEDNAPVSIMLDGVFMYSPGELEWRIHYERRLSEEDAKHSSSCGVITKNLYIGADGIVSPCMGMADCAFAEHFPNLKDIPLKDILRDSEFVDLCYVTVGDVRDHNPECRKCRFVDICAGGCRNSVLMQGNDYLGIDKELCNFFENGWNERIRKAAEPAFQEYIKRNPPKPVDRPKVEEDELIC